MFCASVWAAPGDLYVTGGALVKITPAGVQTTVDGLAPYAVAFDNAGNLYVSDEGGSIWKFAPNGTKSIYASGLSSPQALALNRSNNNICVGTNDGIILLSPGGGRVTVDTVVARGLAFDNSGNLLATTGPSTILSYPMGHGPASTVTNTLSGGPNFLVTDSFGNLYVSVLGNSQPGAGSIFKISFSGSTFASGLTVPGGLAFDSAGNLYEAELDGTINKFTPAGMQTQFCPPTAGLSACRGLAFDSAGNLFVADDFNNVIYKVDTAGNRTIFYYAPGNSNGIAFDAMGILYLADSGHGSIFKYLPNGTRAVFASGLAPVGLRVNPTGILFETDADGTINKFSPDGTKTIFSATGLSNLMGLVFDSSGKLLVAGHDNNNIYKFDASGTRTVFASSLDGPLDLAIDSNDSVYETENEMVNQFTSSGIHGQFAHLRALGVAIDSASNVYLAERAAGVVIDPNTIYKYTSGIQSIFASNVHGCRFLAFEPVVTFVITGVTHPASNHFTITGKAAPNYTYSVQYSADLSGSFAPIPNATPTANPSGVVQYDDGTHTTASRGFYRLAYP